jgi:hypothetical protein
MVDDRQKAREQRVAETFLEALITITGAAHEVAAWYSEGPPQGRDALVGRVISTALGAASRQFAAVADRLRHQADAHEAAQAASEGKEKPS